MSLIPLFTDFRVRVLGPDEVENDDGVEGVIDQQGPLHRPRTPSRDNDIDGGADFSP